VTSGNSVIKRTACYPQGTQDSGVVRTEFSVGRDGRVLVARVLVSGSDYAALPTSFPRTKLKGRNVVYRTGREMNGARMLCAQRDLSSAVARLVFEIVSK
jgi:hypothetical protein